MSTLKEQLEVAGYDTSSLDENTIINQLDKAGYDVSSYQQQKSIEPPPILDTGLRTMTGSISPIPPIPLPKGAAEIPITTGQEAGKKVTEMVAETKFGQKHPYLTAGLGTVTQMAPDIFYSGVGIKGAPAVGETVRPLYTGVRTLGKELGEEMTKVGLKRAPEMIGEPRTRTVILEMLESLRPLKDRSIAEIQEVLTPQGIVQKYDEIGRILDYLKVAKSGVQPKQLVAKSSIQELSTLKDKFAQAIKEYAPKVGKKMGEMSLASKRDIVLKALGKTAGIAGPAGLVGAAGYGGYKLSRGLFQ